MKLSQNRIVGQFVSFLIFVAFFTILPHLLKPLMGYIEHLDGKIIFAIMIGLAINGVLLSYNIVMYFVYTGKYAWLEQYRVNDRAWPWEENPHKWKQTFKRTLSWVLFNSVVVLAIVPAVDFLINGFPFKTSLEEWPTATVMLGQFVLFMLVEDIGFYWSHYVLHTSYFYWVHKQHHEYYNTICLTATYAHPLEVLFSNVLPTYMGYRMLSLYMPVHVIIITIWMLFRMLETCDNHCGYEWSWGQLSFFPWKLGSEYHNFHHSHNVGNFGSMFEIWDYVMGSNVEYHKFQKKRIK